MKTVAYIGRDFFAAKNLFLEMKRLALARDLKVEARAQPIPTLTVGAGENATTYTFFYRGNLTSMVGCNFGGVWITTTLTPEQEAIARATLADSKGNWIEGKPALEG